MYYTKIYNKATIYASQLIWTPLSPFDIKGKKRNVRNLYLEGQAFHVFLRLHWIMGGFPRYLLEFLWIVLQKSIQALCNIWDGALSDRKNK